jgi:arsenate reductase (thioredoxin)
MKKVLFVCIHNSARSQMAEAFLKHHCGEFFEVHSCGLKPGKLNPLVVEAMAEVSLDISQNQTKDIFPFIRMQPTFDYVITLCDEARGENCPTFPRQVTRLHWSFPDPSAFADPPEEKLARTREVRDAIQARVEAWCAQVCAQQMA